MKDLLPGCEHDLEAGAGLAVGHGNDKVVLHTTETPRGSLNTVRNLWRGSGNWGKGLPHFLIDGPRRVQLLGLNVNAYTLENKPGGIDPNRSGRTIQVEVVGYSADGWDVDTYQSVGEWIGDLMTAGLCLDLDQCPRFLGPADQAYLATYTSANRNVIEDWPGFNGVCGHQHVKEQAHWDPGPIDVHRLCEIARRHCHPGDAFDMATLQELETIIRRVAKETPNSILAGRKDAKGVEHIYECFLATGWCHHLGPVGDRSARYSGVEYLGVKGEELWSRFTPIEGHWAET